MQIILSDSECNTIYEALLTEIQSLRNERELERQKGRTGGLTTKYIQRAEALLERIKPYAK